MRRDCSSCPLRERMCLAPRAVGRPPLPGPKGRPGESGGPPDRLRVRGATAMPGRKAVFAVAVGVGRVPSRPSATHPGKPPCPRGSRPAAVGCWPFCRSPLLSSRTAKERESGSTDTQGAAPSAVGRCLLAATHHEPRATAVPPLAVVVRSEGPRGPAARRPWPCGPDGRRRSETAPERLWSRASPKHRSNTSPAPAGWSRRPGPPHPPSRSEAGPAAACRHRWR